LNVCDNASRDAHLMARRERDRLAMQATLSQARRAVLASRTGAGAKGGLIGLAVALITWPFAHMKQ
jgi:hypothetical protein